MAAAKKKEEVKNPMVATPVDSTSVELASTPEDTDIKYRYDFKSYKEYNQFKGKKG